MSPRKTKQTAFSVIELCVLLSILGLLAAVVVPQFSQARTESKLSKLVSSLQTVRSQLELYRIQHDERLPGQHEQGARIDMQQFVRDLTERNPVDGFGPYLDEIPANPFVDEQYARRVKFVDTERHVPRVLEGYGWCLNTTTGHFYACDNADHLQY